MKDNLKCPVISAERLKTLMYNLVTFMNTEIIPHMTLEEKLELLKDEIGFTDEEIESLKLVENCLEEVTFGGSNR